MNIVRDDWLATVYKVRTVILVGQGRKDRLIKIIQQEIGSFDTRYEIKEFDKPKTWRLLTQATAERGVEEAVFTVQGVIITKDLPPLREKPK